MGPERHDCHRKRIIVLVTLHQASKQQQLVGSGTLKVDAEPVLEIADPATKPWTCLSSSSMVQATTRLWRRMASISFGANSA
jgi:hypothetical protein